MRAQTASTISGKLASMLLISTVPWSLKRTGFHEALCRLPPPARTDGAPPPPDPSPKTRPCSALFADRPGPPRGSRKHSNHPPHAGPHRDLRSRECPCSGPSWRRTHLSYLRTSFVERAGACEGHERRIEGGGEVVQAEKLPLRGGRGVERRLHVGPN